VDRQGFPGLRLRLLLLPPRVQSEPSADVQGIPPSHELADVPKEVLRLPGLPVGLAEPPELTIQAGQLTEVPPLPPTVSDLTVDPKRFIQLRPGRPPFASMQEDRTPDVPDPALESPVRLVRTAHLPQGLLEVRLGPIGIPDFPEQKAEHRGDRFPLGASGGEGPEPEGQLFARLPDRLPSSGEIGRHEIGREGKSPVFLHPRAQGRPEGLPEDRDPPIRATPPDPEVPPQAEEPGPDLPLLRFVPGHTALPPALPLPRALAATLQELPGARQDGLADRVGPGSLVEPVEPRRQQEDLREHPLLQGGPVGREKVVPFPLQDVPLVAPEADQVRVVGDQASGDLRPRRAAPRIVVQAPVQGVAIRGQALQQPLVHQRVQRGGVPPGDRQGGLLGKAVGLGREEGEGGEELPRLPGQGRVAQADHGPEGADLGLPGQGIGGKQAQAEPRILQGRKGLPDAPGLGSVAPVGQEAPRQDEPQGQPPQRADDPLAGGPIRLDRLGRQLPEEREPLRQIELPDPLHGLPAIEGHVRAPGGEQVGAEGTADAQGQGDLRPPDVVQDQQHPTPLQGLPDPGAPLRQRSSRPKDLRGQARRLAPPVEPEEGIRIGAQGGPEHPVGEAGADLPIVGQLKGQGGLSHAGEPHQGDAPLLPLDQASPEGLQDEGPSHRGPGRAGRGQEGNPGGGRRRAERVGLPAALQRRRQEADGPVLLLEEGRPGQVEQVPGPLGRAPPKVALREDQVGAPPPLLRARFARIGAQRLDPRPEGLPQGQAGRAPPVPRDTAVQAQDPHEGAARQAAEVPVAPKRPPKDPDVDLHPGITSPHRRGTSDGGASSFHLLFPGSAPPKTLGTGPGPDLFRTSFGPADGKEP